MLRRCSGLGNGGPLKFTLQLGLEGRGGEVLKGVVFGSSNVTSGKGCAHLYKGEWKMRSLTLPSLGLISSQEGAILEAVIGPARYWSLGFPGLETHEYIYITGKVPVSGILSQ